MRGRWQLATALLLAGSLIAAQPAAAATPATPFTAPASPGAAFAAAQGHHRAAAPATPAEVDAALTQLTGLPSGQLTFVDPCAAGASGRASCQAELVVLRSDRRAVHPRVRARATFTQVFGSWWRAHHGTAALNASTAAGATPATGGGTAPSVGTPGFLQDAYDLQYLSQTAGAGVTVAIVDAYDDPSAEADLATFRSTYGLPGCSSASGCFTKVNESGQASPLPSGNLGWEEEESLDLDAVSALCPNCHLLLVEANSNSTSDLDAAIQTAQSLGATIISNSWSANSGSPTGSGSFPGAAVLAATGDHGYPGAGVDAYPAAFPTITAVGATSLAATNSAARGFAESAWSLSNGWGGTSGCDTQETKPAWQTDTGCTGRAYSDVSADGDPATGLEVYDSGNGGWLLLGGTSLATPLVAAYEALTGVHGATAQWAYTDSSLLNDPVTGSTGSCASAIAYICNAGPGYDGPTGAGSISGDVVSGAPGIGAETASGSTPSATTLSGGVLPNQLDTTYFWQYGLTTAYGAQTASVDAGSAGTVVPASGSLTGLTSGTTYHYRLVAQNADGIAYGYDETFTTATPTSPPVNTTAPTITGTPSQGDVLTTSTGSWSPTSNVSFSYQWQRSSDGVTWTNIGGATGSSYTLTVPDEGDSLRALVVATDQYGSTTQASGAVGPITPSPPVESGPPTITGTTQRTYTLSASTGTWSGPGIGFSYQWQRSSDGQTWTSIAGATGSRYTLTAADEGDVIRVLVTAANVDGIATATSAATLTISPFPPGELSAPGVSGTPERTYTLTASPGSWSGPDNTYSFQWQRDFGEGFVDIAGATAQTYTLTSSDEGAVVRVVVTASDPDAAIADASQPTATVQAAVPVNQSPPSFTGMAQRTGTLVAEPGQWAGAGNSYVYQWQRSADGNTWTAIAGATGISYTLGVADEGDEVRVLVTATNADGSASAASAATGTIPSSPPVSTALPTISGALQRSAMLTTTLGGWTGIGNAYGYQWQRSPDGSTWSNIAGATGSTYTLATADEGDAIRVKVTATNPDGTVTVASSATGTVTAVPPVNVTAPSISGTPVRSYLLGSSAGTWSGVGNVYSYQWQRSSDGTTWTNIAGGTTPGYTLSTADEGDQIRLQLTATNPDGSVTVTTAPTLAVSSAPPINTSVPVITGVAERGSTLTASYGTWSGIGNDYSYQWQHSLDGSTWTNIAGATTQTYNLSAADEGYAVRVLITASNPDATVTAASPPTVTVPSAPPIETSAPSISGAALRGDLLTGNIGTWGGIGNVYSFQWQHSADGTTWTDVSGATTSVYAVGIPDEGEELRLVVTVTNVDGSATATTAPTAPVQAAAPVDSSLPVITGAAERSVTLTATTGAWSGIGNVYTYQWQHDTGTGFTNVSGATGTTYTLGAADEASLVRVVVTVTNPDGSATASSAPTAAVAGAPPLNLAVPTISGTAQRTITLSGGQGSWDGVGNVYSYQWERSPDGGSTWSAISGATALAYTLGLADEGDLVRLVVTATNPDGTASAASLPSAAVQGAAPQNVTVPSVIGTPVRSAVLTSAPGSWSGLGNSTAYQWQRSSDGATWTDISGATAPTYAVTVADEGDRLRLEVTVTNADGSATADSAPTAAVTGAPPVNTALPVVAGTPQRSTTLFSSPGTWTGVGNAYTYQWQQSADGGATWANVNGATGPTYTLGVDDEGTELRLQVTATNPDSAVSATSAPTAVVTAAPPVNTSPPSLSGTPMRTDTLATTQGSWTGVGNTYSFLWQRSANGGASWTNIPGATSPSYQLTAADEGENVRAVVTASNPDATVSMPSPPSPAVQGAPPVNTKAPSLSGVASQGTTLSVATGNWSPSGATFSYQWQRGDPVNGYTTIAGATGNSYTLSAADVGETVRALVTATNPDGTASAFTAPTVAVMAPPTNVVAPAAPTGTLEDSYTLTPDPGTWNTTVSTSYAWVRCPAGATVLTGACIQVGSGSSYVLSSADIGHPMGVEVTATSPGGSTTISSALTAAVSGRPLTNLEPPSIVGDPQVPQTLSAQPGTWSVSLTTIGYTWERCAADGVSNCVEVASGTSGYTLSQADLGHTIVLVAQAVSPGRSATAQSAALMVQAQPTPQAATRPQITGQAERTQILSASAGSWTNSPTSITYQWERCDTSGASCLPIGGATGSDYTLTHSDEGSTITVQVTATNSSGSATATAAATNVVLAAAAVNTQPPAIVGTVQQGQDLQAEGASWQAPSDTTYVTQWERCNSSGAQCEAISGATQAQYTPVAADVGHTLVVQIAATNPDGTVVAASPASAVVVVAAPRWVTLPTISADSGFPGDALTMTPGTWSGPPVSSDLVEMMRCTNVCVSAASAASTYTISDSDLGAILRVRETATNSGGSTVVWSASYVGPVISASAGDAVLSAGNATVRGAHGIALATAQLSAVTLHADAEKLGAKAAPSPRRLRLHRARGLRGRLRAWACVVTNARGGAPGACSARVTFSGSGQIVLPARLSGRIRVVVVRVGRP